MKQSLEILHEYDFNFPPLFSNNKGSNETIYNRYIKEVCRLAGIDSVIDWSFRDPKTKRYVSKKVPKWKAVTSHIGRRSFATNFYGKINTSLLIDATGHSTEVQFLRYVGNVGDQNAKLLAEEMRRVLAKN